VLAKVGISSRISARLMELQNALGGCFEKDRYSLTIDPLFAVPNIAFFGSESNVRSFIGISVDLAKLGFGFSADDLKKLAPTEWILTYRSTLDRHLRSIKSASALHEFMSDDSNRFYTGKNVHATAKDYKGTIFAVDVFTKQGNDDVNRPPPS
jgi:hypothetical protein